MQPSLLTGGKKGQINDVKSNASLKRAQRDWGMKNNNSRVMIMETYHYGKFKFDIHNNMMRYINFGVEAHTGQRAI